MKRCFASGAAVVNDASVDSVQNRLQERLQRGVRLTLAVMPGSSRP